MRVEPKWLLVLSLGMLAAGPVHAGSCGAQEPALREIKLTTWPAYYRNQDAAGLAAFLLEGFLVVGGDGSVSPRAEELAWVAKSPWNPKDFTYAIDSITCPTDSVAIIVGEGRFKAHDKGKGAWFEHRYVSSNVLVRVGGTWKAAGSHISGERSTPLPN